MSIVSPSASDIVTNVAVTDHQAEKAPEDNTHGGCGECGRARQLKHSAESLPATAAREQLWPGMMSR